MDQETLKPVRVGSATEKTDMIPSSSSSKKLAPTKQQQLVGEKINVWDKKGSVCMVKEEMDDARSHSDSENDDLAPILAAGKAGLWDRVKDLVNPGNVNVKDGRGRTIMHYAVRSERLDVVDLLIETGGDVNAKDDTGASVIHHAFQYSSERFKIKGDEREKHYLRQWVMDALYQQRCLIDRLIKAGGDVNAKDDKGTSIMHYAVQCSLQSMELFKDKGDVSDWDWRWSVMDVLHQQTYLIDRLIKAGGDVSTKNNKGTSVVQYAVQYYFLQSLELLKGMGHVSDKHWCAKGKVVLDRQIYLIDHLIEAGGGFSAKDDKGTSIMHYAVQCSVQSLELLTGMGDVSEKNWHEGVMDALYQQIHLIDRLKKTVGDVNTKDDTGTSIMHYALQFSLHSLQLLKNMGDVRDERLSERITEALNQQSCLIDHLIEAGADVNAKDDTGTSIVHYATQCSLQSLELLKNMGDVRDERLRTIVMNVQRCQTELVAGLIKHGADVNAKDDKGRSLVLSAVQCSLQSLNLNKYLPGSVMGKLCLQQIHLINHFIKASGEVNAKDDKGTSIMHYALQFSLHSLQLSKRMGGVRDEQWRVMVMDVQWQQTEMIDSLIKADGEVNAKDDKGTSFMHYAVQLSQHSLELLKRMGDVRDEHWTERVTGALNQQKRLTDHLIEAGADVNAKDDKGRSIMYHAVQCSLQSLELLKKMGDVRDERLSERVTEVLHQQRRLIDHLIKAGGDVNAKDDKGTSIMRFAVQRSLQSLEQLKGKGDVRDENMTGKLMVVLQLQRRLIDYLIEAGGDVNATDEGWHRLYSSAETLLRPEMMDLLRKPMGEMLRPIIDDTQKENPNILSVQENVSDHTESKYVEELDVSFATSIVPPEIESEIKVSDLSDSSAIISFDAPKVTANYDGFNISISPATNGETFAEIPGDVQSPSIVLSNLVPGTEYTVTVNTVTENQQGAKKTCQFRTLSTFELSFSLDQDFTCELEDSNSEVYNNFKGQIINMLKDACGDKIGEILSVTFKEGSIKVTVRVEYRGNWQDVKRTIKERLVKYSEDFPSMRINRNSIKIKPFCNTDVNENIRETSESSETGNVKQTSKVSGTGNITNICGKRNVNIEQNLTTSCFHQEASSGQHEKQDGYCLNCSMQDCAIGTLAPPLTDCDLQVSHVFTSTDVSAGDSSKPSYKCEGCNSSLEQATNGETADCNSDDVDGDISPASKTDTVNQTCKITGLGNIGNVYSGGNLIMNRNENIDDDLQESPNELEDKPVPLGEQKMQDECCLENREEGSEIVADLEISFSLNQAFTDNLEDHDSQEYRNLKERIEELLRVAYGADLLEIKEIKFNRGILDVTITFRDTSGRDPKDIMNVYLENLRDGTFGGVVIHLSEGDIGHDGTIPQMDNAIRKGNIDGINSEKEVNIHQNIHVNSYFMRRQQIAQPTQN